jgi:hypothetical protein
MRLIAWFALALLGCGGTTGSALVTFTARAGGPADATGGSLEFDTGTGFHVKLDRAKLHIGAIYLNKEKVASGAPQLSCVLPGIYVGEAFGDCHVDPNSGNNVCGVDVDLLSPALQPFPVLGRGTANPAIEADIWFSGGDVNAADDPTPILDVAGSATQMGQSWPFTGIVTIGQNRAMKAPDPAEPGAHPICGKRHIYPPICLQPTLDDAGMPDCVSGFTLSDGGTLDLRADPRAMFNGLVFSSLQNPTGTPPVYTIPDADGGIGGQLYKGVIANSGVYQFTWTDRVQ